MNFIYAKDYLDNFVGKMVSVFHADDMDEDGPYTEFRAVMQGYRLDVQFGVVNIHFQGHKDLEISVDDVMISDDGITGEDVCGLFFVVNAAA